MPERLERGLVSLFSTIQVNGIRITLGEPPSHPDMDWARVHLLAAAVQQIDQVFPQRLILGHIYFYSWTSGGSKTSPSGADRSGGPSY
jgi:hypothetical protein